MAKEQNAREDAAARTGSPILVCDTDARVTAVWEERYLGTASPEVLSMAREPALHLLTDHVGVPFEDDGLRDGEHLRAWMTRRFREVLAGHPVVELTGSHDHRLATALAAVDVLAVALDHRYVSGRQAARCAATSSRNGRAVRPHPRQAS